MSFTAGPFLYVKPADLKYAAKSLHHVVEEMDKRITTGMGPMTLLKPLGKDPVSSSAAAYLAKHAAEGLEKLARAARVLEQYAVNAELSAAAYLNGEDENSRDIPADAEWWREKEDFKAFPPIAVERRFEELRSIAATTYDYGEAL